MMVATSSATAASLAEQRSSTEQEQGRPGRATDADAGGQLVTDADADAAHPVTASALPADVLDHIARQLGFRGWAALKYFWMLERAVLVPDGAPTINAAINAAGHDGVVLVRPGLYSESVRVTRDLTLCGLGPLGSVVVQPPGCPPPVINRGNAQLASMCRR